MRYLESGGPLIQEDRCPYKEKGTLDTDMHMGRTPREDEGRDWVMLQQAKEDQERQQAPRNQERGTGHPAEGCQPADT